MIRNYLILIVTIIMCFNCSSNKPVEYYDLPSLYEDLEVVNDTITTITHNMLEANSDSAVVKNIEIIISDKIDTLVVHGKDSVIVDSEESSNSIYKYDLMRSTFYAYSFNLYFENKYWAKLNFDYLYRDSLYTYFSEIEFDRQE